MKRTSQNKENHDRCLSANTQRQSPWLALTGCLNRTYFIDDLVALVRVH